MTTREFVLLVLFLLVVLGNVLDRQLALRLEWIQFGRSYEQTQAQVVTALQALDARLKPLEVPPAAKK